MKSILETKPPFVIKIYDTFFHISWDGLSDKIEDRYYYEKIKSVKNNKGRLNKEWTVLGLLTDTILDTTISEVEHNSDELLIELKSGEIETRYFQGESSDKCIGAIELIKTKLS